MSKDLVPQALRQEWRARGWCPGEDVFSVFTTRVREHPGKVAVIDDKGETSYAQLSREALAVAKALSAEGVRAGDIVGIYLPNRHEACAVELGIAAIGAASIAFPVMYRAKEVRSLLGRSRAVACITMNSHNGFDHAMVVRGLIDELPDLRSCLVLGGQVPGCISLDPVLAAAGDSRGDSRSSWAG